MIDWFIKVGNSRIVAWDGHKKYFSWPTSKPDLSKLKSARSIFYFSVVPSASLKIKKFARIHHIEAREIRRKDLSVKTSYSKTLGIDRLMNIFSAKFLTRKHFVVLDIGTAITVDFYSQSRGHLGGWIAAGPHLMAKALSMHTAKVPFVPPRPFKKSIGRNTRDALLGGQQAYLNGILSEARRLAKVVFNSKSFDIFLTGGGAPLLQSGGFIHLDHLALKGLKRIRMDS